ncbi:hypothetical protein OH76DRAFT_1395953 [Lentinus brumalis]|uniref:Uncharacterized protein n=1 Tax=Lentinus brumalis TaxID=2498619 RepID=A0A371DW94_9APHY|nr:hypothetical protein OH76DRAFT_1395953 [Polyporus brumalis]
MALALGGSSSNHRARQSTCCRNLAGRLRQPLLLSWDGHLRSLRRRITLSHTYVCYFVYRRPMSISVPSQEARQTCVVFSAVSLAARLFVV